MLKSESGLTASEGSACCGLAVWITVIRPRVFWRLGSLPVAHSGEGRPRRPGGVSIHPCTHPPHPQAVPVHPDHAHQCMPGCHQCNCHDLGRKTQKQTHTMCNTGIDSLVRVSGRASWRRGPGSQELQGQQELARRGEVKFTGQPGPWPCA